MDTRKLIKKCQKNNRKAQSELFHLYRDILFALSLKYCKNYDEAEDNLQDSFITIFKKINQYSFKGSFEGWMKRITINKAIDKYKKTSFTDININEENLADTRIDSETLNLSLDELLKHIQELPDRYRLVFNLYELDEYSHKEIAKMLHISEGTSKSNLHRAKVILKTKITSSNNCLKKIAISNG
ncbi:RNA polymerase sigma-70 factor (ECF subfamily) [Aquimarina sp. MAR_2010_214]|uniref:RNA polymerase sigma factor n=1 Tax=Aquimarina sp. MAR_2010_214 TaxID=1250026 RepID=UPI000C715558|nr:RNA polymerase sigma factor [Aquimarina sp. MAR_2010_214]PKV49721.1 RNA polymerase sigma-70 factor (ECF subfamily) [Aquimarina sp. MAR_2010_214]